MDNYIKSVRQRTEEFIAALLQEAYQTGRQGDGEERTVERLLKKFVDREKALATERWCDLT